MAKGLRSKSAKKLRAVKRQTFGAAQAEVTLRVTQAQMRIRLGTATPQDLEDVRISHRLSGEGYFARDGDMTTKKRFTFSKTAASAK